MSHFPRQKDGKSSTPMHAPSVPLNKTLINSSVTVTKPTPYTFDAFHLLALDPNPLTLPPAPFNSAELEDALRSTARDGAQALLNQLLSTLPITSTPSGVLLTLPPGSTPLPREKPLPPEKAATKWEQFARKKGITKKKREGKMVYDEATGEWIPRYGFKGANKKGDDAWIVEVDEKKEKQLEEEGKGRTIRTENRRQRVERVKRNERKQRANERRARKGIKG
jgi:regulator of ribosome biosynthesis